MQSETLSYFWEVIKWISPVVISVIGYFIGQIMNRLNKVEEKITQLEVDVFQLERVEKKQTEIAADLKKIEEKITQLEVDAFRIERVEKKQEDIIAELGKIKEGLSDVKINYISKQDFFNSIHKLDEKMERIANLIMERGVKQ